MPLPPPRTGAPPPQRQLTSSAYAAILDDSTVAGDLRVAVLHELEGSSDPEVMFSGFCANENFRGPLVPSTAIVTGRVMTLEAFERGLVGGWFGTARMSGAVARSNIQRLTSSVASLGSTIGSIAVFQALLDPGPSPSPLTERVTWYYYDDANQAQPMAHVAPNLAIRLALPSAKGGAVVSGTKTFIVLRISATSLQEPRKPRFTDCEVLSYLDLWRPGGRTAPLEAGLTGLDELVDRPTVLGRVTDEFHIVDCKVL